MVLPDVLANAGGVVGSYFEWFLNRSAGRWDLHRHNVELARVMGEAYDDVRDAADRHGCSFRQAAFTVAVQRVRVARRGTSPWSTIARLSEQREPRLTT